jgi:Zn-dependent protease with chaperone function
VACTPVPLPGFVVHDLSLYDRAEQADARAAFGLDDAPHILAVAAGSPAAAAGITPQDALVSIDGAPVPARTATAASFARVAAIDDALAAAAATGVLELGLVRDGVPRTVHLDLERGCASRFDVRASETGDAAADGHYIQITTGYAARADSDDALAIVLAHELAHNILGHRARLDSEHVQRGLPQMFGRNARLTRETELEADRLSIRLVAAAGYSVDAAIAWRRKSWGTLEQTLFRSPTHPSASERLAALEQESQILSR